MEIGRGNERPETEQGPAGRIDYVPRHYSTVILKQVQGDSNQTVMLLVSASIRCFIGSRTSAISKDRRVLI
jgi:hypothetical protein